ncbi:MAG: hypothetical protein J0M12_10530 [Deltaproteobacteria bacterium]|nr:hypothetical protein [Deltaproteobacteria bacterium]
MRSFFLPAVCSILCTFATVEASPLAAPMSGDGQSSEQIVQSTLSGDDAADATCQGEGVPMQIPGVGTVCVRPHPDGFPNTWLICRKVDGLNLCATLRIRCATNGSCKIEVIFGPDRYDCTIVPDVGGTFKVECKATHAFIFAEDPSVLGYYMYTDCDGKLCLCFEAPLDPGAVGPPLMRCLSLSDLLRLPLLPKILPLLPGYPEIPGMLEP